MDLGNPRRYLSLWERFIASIYSDFGDALWLGFHINCCMNTDFLNVSVFVSRTYVIVTYWRLFTPNSFDCIHAPQDTFPVIEGNMPIDGVS